MTDNLPRRVQETLKTQNKGSITVAITSNHHTDHTFAIDREDYTEETKQVANAMAVGTTEEAKNEYSLDPGEMNEIKLTRADGNPATIVDGGPGGKNVYINEPGLNPEGRNNFETLSDTGTFDFKVIKGKASPADVVSSVGMPNSKRRYMQVLGDLAEKGANSEIATNVQRVLGENNRFSGTDPYLIPGVTEGRSHVGKVVVQTEFGKHSPKPSNQEVTLKVEALKNLGIQMLLKGSGEIIIPEDDTAFEVFGAKLGSLVPGLARVGMRVPVTSFEPGRIISDINPDYSKPRNPDIASTDLLSYGSFNNPLVPFDAIDSNLSLAAASILVATMALVFEALSVAFDPKSALQSPLANSLFGVVDDASVHTQYDYVECVREGFKVFFGMNSQSGGVLGAVGGGAISAAGGALGAVGAVGSNLLGFAGSGRFSKEPGWYNTILRHLTRLIAYEVAQSAFSVVLPLGNIEGNVGPFTADGGLDIQEPGLTKDPSNIFNMLKRITHSRIVGFLNVLANIGDIKLSLEAQGLDSGDVSADGLQSFPYLLDTTDGVREERVFGPAGLGPDIINPASLIRKDFLSSQGSLLAGNHNRSLAWGQGTTPSIYILPDSIQRAGDAIGGQGVGAKIVGKLKKEKGFAKPSDGGARLSNDLVTAIENELEVSYVPFYFHDLRTNEIISFHAFLENITDGFSAEYNEQSGYGRIGSVMTYKNTKRSIGMTFRVVATSPTDFDNMWWKINKLVTLVYPQYTIGRSVEFENKKFVQPFSQLPAASPLIRLRLGDVFKSNYSKFNLARLFGLGQGDTYFKMRASDVANNTQRNAQIAQQVQNIRNTMLGNEFEIGDVFFVEHLEDTARPGAQSTRQQNSRQRTHTTGRSLVPTTAQIDAQMSAANQDPTLARALAVDALAHAPAPTGTTGARRAARAASGAANDRGSLPAGRYRVHVVQTDVSMLSTSHKVKYIVSVDGRSPSERYSVTLTNLFNATGNEGQGDAAQMGVTLDDDYIIHKATSRVPMPEGGAADPSADASIVRDFFSTDANPIMKAFETTKGKGLAGFITSMNFDWNDATWNTEGFGRKAPMHCKIDISFSPIHDLNPGIDADGFNTAPVYRVGSVSEATNNSVGDDFKEQEKANDKFDQLTNALQYRSNNR